VDRFAQIVDHEMIADAWRDPRVREEAMVNSVSVTSTVVMLPPGDRVLWLGGMELLPMVIPGIGAIVPPPHAARIATNKSKLLRKITGGFNGRSLSRYLVT
jgi:hypothetical protein